MKDGTPQNHKEDLFNQMHGDDGGMWQNAFHGFYKCNASVEQLHNFTNHSWVEAIEEDAVVSASTIEYVNSELWNLDRIDQRSTTGDGTFQYTYTGAGINIYILDTGVRSTHVEFSGRVTAGQDFVGDGYNATTDCNGHGTHVSGIAAGLNVGVAKAATIVPVRVMDCSGSGTYSAIMNALDWVATQPQPGVINLSLGGSFSSILNAFVDAVVAIGFHVAIAAGNDDADACSYSPASASSAITAGATTITDAMSSFSNYGSCVDIFSPGSNILSSYNTADDAYAIMSGTSMASPLVAGTVAAYLQASPTTTPANMVTFLKSVGTANTLTGLPSSASPNLLLYSAGSLSASPASPSLSANPSRSPNPSASHSVSPSPRAIHSPSRSPVKPSPSSSLIPASPRPSGSPSPSLRAIPRHSPSPSPKASKKEDNCKGGRLHRFGWCEPEKDMRHGPGRRVAVGSMFDTAAAELWGYPAAQWTRVAELSAAARQAVAQRIVGVAQAEYPEGFHAELVTSSPDATPFALPQRANAQVTVTHWGAGVAKAVITEFDPISRHVSALLGEASAAGGQILAAFQVERLTEDGGVANSSPFHFVAHVPRSSAPIQVHLHTPGHQGGSELVSQGGRIDAVADDAYAIVVPYSAFVVVRGQQAHTSISAPLQPTTNLLLLLLSGAVVLAAAGWAHRRQGSCGGPVLPPKPTAVAGWGPEDV
eukprot:EG_transcript_3245